MFTLTEKGRALLAKIFAGGLNLEITRVMTSSEENLQNISALEVLPSEKDECAILSKTQNDNEFIFQVSLSNVQSVGNYPIHQIGIYVADPDEEEVLYGVFTLSYPFFMPSSSEALRRYEPILKIVFDTVPNITINVDPARFATLQDIEDAKSYSDSKLVQKIEEAKNYSDSMLQQKITFSTTDLTAGTSSLANDRLYIVYE